MVRRYGRCPRGKRLIAKVPHGHWKTMILVAALRIDGIKAPYVMDGAIHGAAFPTYVEKVLAPTLREGDIVFLDNLRPHKVNGVGGRNHPISPGIFTRPQSDRASICQTQVRAP